jgi:Polymer-forming cytoskeletal
VFDRDDDCEREVDMLNIMKSSVPEKDKDSAEVIGRAVQPHDQASARSEPTTKPGTASCIGSDMSIVGNIACNGPVHIFGRIEGELRASDLLINDGAQVEGNVIAQDVTVCRERQGHHPCRPRQAAERWCGRGRHFSSVISDRRELSV